MNFHNWLHMAVSELTQSESPRRDAEILLGYVTGRARTYILAFGETIITNTQKQHLAILLACRKNGIPIAYLTGEREFWSLRLHVSPVTLIPRPDTERLVEEALVHLPSDACHVLDLGTGTGAIALALASERPDCQITAVDIMLNVIQLARYNVKYFGIQNVQIEQSNWFSTLTGKLFDVIVSNPPYINKKDPYLLQGDVRFEPRIALLASEDGMANIRHIVTVSRRHLYTGGWLLIEHGWMQGSMVRMLFNEAGFRNVETYRDYGDNERLTLGQWK